jgi:GT2 family glycosyltransferase
MNVSIIYVNYKTGELILNSIRSVKELTEGISYEIIVVDNHSEDNSLSLLKETYPEIIYIQSPENVGFGRANNLGIKASSGECILFLNPDTLLMNNAVAVLYHFMKSSGQTGACGGNLYDENRQPAKSFGRSFPSFRQELAAIFYLPSYYFKAPRSQAFNYTDKPLQVAFILGADLMVKKETLEKAGAFDSDFFLNYEETELCYRIKQAGFKIMSVPEAKIIHLEGRAPYISKSHLFYFYQGAFIFFSKMYGEKGAKKLYRYIQLKNTIRIIQFTLLMNKNKINYWKMKKQTNKKAFFALKNK